MRILIISDIHANPWALEAVEKDAGQVDRVLCAGDTVNYGPAPGACIDWLKKNDAAVICGNHDHAVAADADPKAAPGKQPLALAMRDWTRTQLRAPDIEWLRRLPRQKTFELADAVWLMLHGTPADPLYDYRLRPDVADQILDKMMHDVAAEVLVVGHTHLPFVRVRRKLQIVNPGSVGQPLDGDSRAAYAIWNKGKIELRRVAYDQSPLLTALRALPLIESQIEDLARIIQTGTA